MKRFTWVKASLLALACLVGPSVDAQTDTVEVRIFGAQRDDRGLRLVELANGDVLTLSVSNSTTDNQPRAWIHRYDASVQPLWQATVADEPLLQPVDAVEHGKGLITVLGMRYANAADAYDWGWYTVDSEGTSVATAHWGTSAWDLPSRVLHRNDSLWTVGTSYASGGGDVHCTLHTWANGGWVLATQWSWDSGAEDVVADAEFFGASLGVATTADSDARAELTVFDPVSGATQWTYATAFDSPTTAQALSVRDSSAVVLINAETPNGMRLGFAGLTLDGDTILETIPGSGVDVAGRDIVWYSPSNFATIAVTEGLGLGGEEWLFSRWTDGGAWQGGPTFGTQWDEVPAAILHATDGRVWMLGSTDGYSNGRDDVYLVVAPSPSVGNAASTFFQVETNITEEAVHVAEALAASADLAVFPQPVRNRFSLSGVAPSTQWSLMDGSGRVVLHGTGSAGDASNLPAGAYVLQTVAAGSTPQAIPVWVVR